MSDPYVPTSVHPQIPCDLTLLASKILLSTSPEQIGSTRIPFSTVVLYGFKSYSAGAGVNNTGNVYVGFGVDRQPDLLPPGGQITYKADPHDKLDLQGMWLRGAVGDGVQCEYCA